MHDHNHTVEWEFECLRPRTSSGRGWRQTRPSGSGSDVPFEWLRHRRRVRSEISLLSVTINYRIPKKYFMLVNRVSIKRIEKLFQSLPRCVEKSLCCEKYIWIWNSWIRCKSNRQLRFLVIAVVAPLCVQHLSDPLLSPDRNKINYGRKNVYRLCLDISIHDQMHVCLSCFWVGKR